MTTDADFNTSCRELYTQGKVAEPEHLTELRDVRAFDPELDADDFYEYAEACINERALRVWLHEHTVDFGVGYELTNEYEGWFASYVIAHKDWEVLQVDSYQEALLAATRKVLEEI